MVLCVERKKICVANLNVISSIEKRGVSQLNQARENKFNKELTTALLCQFLII